MHLRSWFVSCFSLLSILVAGCPSKDEGDEDAGPDDGAQTSTEASASETSDGQDAATGTTSGSSGSSGRDTEPDAPTCAELACEGGCVEGDPGDCIPESTCIVPATEACVTCVEETCGARDPGSIDYFNTIGLCQDFDPLPWVYCMLDMCADACEGPFLSKCQCL